MLGFGKKKKKEESDKKDKSGKEAASEKKDPKATDKKKGGADAEKGGKRAGLLKKITSLITIKRLIVVFLVLAAVSASSYVVYSLYFKTSDPMDPDAKYKPVALAHFHLPEEMMAFTFTHFRNLYYAMVDCNQEITLLDAEIDRIDAIANKYPDEKKITDKQKKVWQKVKLSLEKTIGKIEKTIKQIYVLFSVNKEQGRLQIEEKKVDLSTLMHESLASANEKTQRLKNKETVPSGFVKGNFYKLKKIVFGIFGK